MIKSKAFELIKTFNPRDFKLLEEFLKSPIHNKNLRLVKLYDSIKEYYPEFDENSLTRESLFAMLHPGKEYKDNVMRKILSSFNNKVQEFLAYVNFNSDKLEIKKHLVSELNKRNAEKFLEENYKDAEEILNYSKCAEDLLDYKYNLELEKNTLFIKKNKFHFDESTLRESDYLIKFFLVKILRRYAYILNKRIYELNINVELTFLDEILKHLRENYYSEIPAISLYFNIIMLMLNEDNKLYFNEIDRILKLNEKELGRIDIYNAYFILNNYYLKKQDRGSDIYVKELLDLYKSQLAKGIYKVEEYMHPTLFLNIVKTGTRLKEFDWVDKFIEKYIKDIDPAHRENTYNFAKAILSFFVKDYNSCMNFLSILKFNGYYHRLDVYGYMLRVYYEQNEVEPIISMVDSYKHILVKDKLIPEYRKNEYNSFARFISYLVKMKVSGDYSSLGMLKKELENMHQVSCTGWFMEKFNALERQFFTQNNSV